MRRIKTAGCGWSISDGTYTCHGLPKLDIVFGTTSLVGSTVDGIVYDQFNRLPQHIEGFRMTLSPILDMGGTAISPEVPELACRVNFDPFDDSTDSVLNTGSDLTVNDLLKNTGFIDMYNNGPGYKDKFYVSVSGTTYHMRDDSDYPIYTDSAVMEPGALEPMLDTQFGPVQIDMPPTPDLTTDAIIYSLAGLQSWRHTIDTRVSNTYVNVSETGMVNLENAKNQAGPCSQFNIVAVPSATASFATVIGAPDFSDYPSYMITGGTLTVDGVLLPKEVEPFSPPGAIFDAYLDVFRYNNILGATITTTDPSLPNLPISLPPSTGVFEHLKFEYIGSVRSVTTANGPISGSTAWKLYEIDQGDCIYEITIGGGTGGGGPYEYDGPFKVTVSGSESGVTVEVTGIDHIMDGDHWKTMAGHITFAGLWDSGIIANTWTSAFPTSQLLEGGEADVFLRVAALTTTTTTTTESEVTTPVIVTDEEQNQEVVYNTTTDTSYSTGYAYYVNTFPGWSQPEPKDPGQTVTVTESAPYIVRLAKITGVSMVIDHTTNTGTPQQDPDVEGIVPETAEDLAGVGADVSYNTTSAEGPAATITGGTIHLVEGGTCTGFSVIGETVSVWYKASGGNVKQVQHGDVYVDGRWL